MHKIDLAAKTGFLIATLCVAACTRESAPKQTTSAIDSPSASEPIADLKQPVQEAEQQRPDWFETIMHCGDTSFLRKTPQQQLAELQKNPFWQCEIAEWEGKTNVVCKPSEPQRAFNGRITSVLFNQSNGVYLQDVTLRDTSLAAVRKEAARVWSRSFKPESNQMLLTSDGSISLLVEYFAKANEVNVSCSVAPDTVENVSLPIGWASSQAQQSSGDSVRFSVDASMTPKLEGDKLLKAIVNCEAEQWLSLNLSERQQMLEPEGIICEYAASASGQAVECSIPETFKSFGLPAQTVRLLDNGELHQTQIDVLSDVNSLRRAIEKKTREPLERYPDSAGRFINRLDERFQFVVYPNADGKRSQLVCKMWSDVELDSSLATAAQPEPVATASTSQPASKSSISGNIQYPGNTPPSMRICAMDKEQKVHRCIQTADGQSTYRIHLLPAGIYTVVAEFNQGDLKAAAHAETIRCVMAPCPQSGLIPVELGVGEQKNGININEFLGNRGDWPKLPSNDR